MPITCRSRKQKLTNEYNRVRFPRRVYDTEFVFRSHHRGTTQLVEIKFVLRDTKYNNCPGRMKKTKRRERVHKNSRRFEKVNQKKNKFIAQY